MADIEAYLKRLERLYSTVGSRRVRIPQKRLDKEFIPVFERLCAAYADASPEERVDTYICLEARDNLLDALVIYGGNSADKARNLAITGKRDKAIPLLKQAIAADSIVDGRGSNELVSRAQQLLLNAVDDSDFDLAPYAAELDLSAQDFSRRALQLHKAAQHLNAAKALGIALEKDQTLQNDSKLVELAKILTHKPANAALVMLREPFQREKFINEAASHHVANRSSRSGGMSPETRFWIMTVFGVVLLAVLPPLLFPLLLGMTASAGGLPPGLIVGVVTSVIYLIGRLKSRG